MEYRQLGRSELSISRLGFGCAPFSGHDYGAIDEIDARNAIRAAWSQGINFYDVADVYGFGRAEEILSSALGPDRHKAVLATKCGLAWDQTGHVRRDGSPQQIRRAVEASLRRLRIEAIPLLQLHWPDPHIPLAVTLGEMECLRSEGKVKHLGLCNLSVEMLKSVVSLTRFESLQIAYNLLCRSPEAELLDVCHANRISVLAHSGLARGFLSGKYSAGCGFSGNDTRTLSRYFSSHDAEAKQSLINALQDVAAGQQVTCSATALRWILDEDRIAAVLAGIKDPTQLAENLRSIAWSLTSHDYARLAKLSAACEGSLSVTLQGKETRNEVVSYRS